MTSVVHWLLRENNLIGTDYVEPFAGGAAVALSLLLEGYSSTVHLNDLSRPIFAFWHCVLHSNEELCSKIEEATVDMDQWYYQKAIYEKAGESDLADLGFATLFLNRTNRSGILAGGVIGGKGQKGNYALDCRFGKPELIRRIQAIGRHRERISIYCEDAQNFIEDMAGELGRRAFFFIDPPYVEKGGSLYLDDYDLAGHYALAADIEKVQQPWVCTYDMASVAFGLHPLRRRVEYGLPYVAHKNYEGREVMYFSDNLILPPSWTGGDGPVRLTLEGNGYRLDGFFTVPLDCYQGHGSK